MNYNDAIRYLDSFVDYEKIGYKGKTFDLGRMRLLARIFGNPQDSFSSIHIAGTKGKGSTASFIAGILKEARFKTGLYTSPHLRDVRERIQIDNEMIERPELAFHANFIREKLGAEKLGFSPTFFEIFTILAFNYFKAKGIDYGVIETGLGGRLDATNIVRPLVSVITNISYDHTDILGEDLRSIAFEKSGIIKKGNIVVSAPQEAGALDAIRKACALLEAELVLLGKDVRFNEVRHDTGGEVFDVHGMLDTYSECAIRLPGNHQVINATCAMAAAEGLKKKGVKIAQEDIKKGLEKTKIPARCEVISKSPYVILDGAQNRKSANALKETIKRNFNYRKLILVLGISKQKDIKGICEELIPHAERVILTKANTARAEEPHVIERHVIPVRGDDIMLTDSVGEAMHEAKSLAGRDDLILITGSFFVASEGRA